jgi:putative transposase
VLIQSGRPKRLVLSYVRLGRSTYYYQHCREDKENHRGGRPRPGWSWTTTGERIPDERIKDLISAAIAGDGTHYGYLKLTYHLRRQHGLVINKKKVYRLCKELRALHPQRKVQANGRRKLARNRVVTDSNQVWATDIKYGYIAGEDRFFFMTSLLDVYDRSVVGCHIGLSCEGKNVLHLLNQSLKQRGAIPKGLVLRSDNGPQYKSKVLRRGCQVLGVEQEYIPPKTPNLNAHIESFHAILEHECLSEHRFSDYYTAVTTVRSYLEFYNERRLHSGCGFRPPMEYYQVTQAGLLPKAQLSI